jgi:hypothetical protein
VGHANGRSFTGCQSRSLSRTIAFVALICLAGCAGRETVTAPAGQLMSPPPTGTPDGGLSTPAPGASAPPAAAEATASPSLATAEPTGPLALPHGNLGPGTYRPVRFSIPLTLEIGAADPQNGWFARTDATFDLELVAQRLAADELAFSIPSALYGADTSDLFASLRSQGVAIGKETSATDGGVTARRVTFTVPSHGRDPRDPLELFGVTSGPGFGSDEGMVESVDVGTTVRLDLIDRGNQSLVIVSNAPSPTEFELFSQQVDELLQTLSFR